MKKNATPPLSGVRKPRRALVLAGLLLTAGTLGAGTASGAPATTPGQSAGQAVSRTFGSATSQSLRSVLVHIQSRFGSGNQCLDADANGGGNGTKVQVWQCNGFDQQQWYWRDGLSLESYRFPGMCLDADLNGGGRDGTKVQLWQCNGTPQQRWAHPEGDLAIYNEQFYNNGNTVLDRNTIAGDGVAVYLWTKNFQPQQWWDIWAD